MFNKKQLQENLIEKSNKALDLFSKVVEDLKEINRKSEIKQSSLLDEKQAIEEEIKELEEMNSKNDRVISNIENILK
jgi:hypothetical protein